MKHYNLVIASKYKGIYRSTKRDLTIVRPKGLRNKKKNKKSNAKRINIE